MNKNKYEYFVSVLVAVYNHEKYLEKCLASIVNQKTNFKYEILIHDDCSTDGSKKIIDSFYKTYPEMIVPIYEKENKYSKGVKINKDILIPKMRGKYFCLCEGDDYWLDESKLQRQYDFLENNKEYKFCVHNSINVNDDGVKIGENIAIKKSGDLCCKDFIINDGSYIATNSIFSYSYLAKKLPCYFNYLSLDYIWQIYLSSVGKTYCFEECMSAYRVESVGSWNARMKNDNNKWILHKKKIIKALNMFNKDTDYKFNEYVKMKILFCNYNILELKRDYKSMKEKKYLDIYRNESFKKKTKFFLDEHFPSFYNFLRNLRRKIR